MTTPHDTFREQLLDLAYGELGRREARALRAHLETCAECQGELERMNATRSAMSALAEVPAPERGENVLLAAAREAARERVRRPFLPSWLWGASIGAVGVAAVAVLTVRFAASQRLQLQPQPQELVGDAPETPKPPPLLRAAPAPSPPAASAPGGGEGGGGTAQAQPEPRGELAKEASSAGGTMEKKREAAPPGPAGPESKFKAEPAERHSASERLADARSESKERARADQDLGLAHREKDEPAVAPPPSARSAASADQDDVKRNVEGTTQGAPPPPAPAAEPLADLEDKAIAKVEEAPAERELPAKRSRAPAPSKAAASAAKPAAPSAGALAAAEDPIARHARLRAAGELHAASRTFTDCAGEAGRTVEADRSGRAVKVTRTGTAGGKAFVLEQFYGEDGALAAVRFASEGRVHELRLGPGPSRAGAAAGVPAFALEPGSAAQAGLDAPPRCGP